MAYDDGPLGSSPPPPGDSQGSSTPAPIGVPRWMYDEDMNVVPYSVPGYQHDPEPYSQYGWETEIRPRYYDGDEYKPANLASTQIWQLQQSLAKVGLLDTSFTRSTWDSSTRNAFRELLGLSNAQGLTWDQTLGELMDSVGGGQGSNSGGPGGTRYTVDANGNVVLAGEGEAPPPLVKVLSDPASLRQTFRKAIIDTLGQGWSQDEINRLVGLYNQMEGQRQEQEYNLKYGISTGGDSQLGGSVIAMPSPEDFAQQQAIEKDPVGAQTETALGFTDEFMRLAGSPAWGVS